MKHTKGEWFVATDNNVYSQHGDARIAIVEADFNISEHEAEANARLIAAAPDLFEALIEAQETINIFCDRNTPNDGSPNGMVMQKIIDAIKKAKGE